MIYRREKSHYEYKDGKRVVITDIPGHVEFYVGNNKVVGWGTIQDKNVLRKEFYKDSDNYCFYSLDNARDKGQPFTIIIRFRSE